MKGSISAIVAASAIVFAVPAAANVILNGSFEGGAFTGGSSLAQQIVPPDSTTISDWTFGGDPQARPTWYENGFDNNLQQIALTAHSGNFALNLADGSVRFVTVSQTFHTLPFQDYQVSYWVGNYSANIGPAPILVNVTDGTSNTILLSETPSAPATDAPSGTWVRFASNFIADGTSSTITFTENSGLTYVGLDDVSVTSVPEPSSWAMMGLGFAGLGFAVFRRGRKTSASIA